MPRQRYSWPVDLPARQEQLEQVLSSGRLDLLRNAAQEAEAAGMPLYIVGGFVRDLILKRPSQDFDLVVEGDAIALAHAMASRFGGKVNAHKRFGTAKWSLAGASITGIGDPDSSMPHFLDFITARSETYPHPGALPAVRPGKLADDLQRRDFSINTLALRLDGEHFGDLRDDLGGLDDLQQGLVRVLHPGSYFDDPTRILRAVRYEQRYGFRIAPSDVEYIIDARPLLSKISGDRLRHELNQILIEDHAAGILARLNELGLIGFIHPSLPWDRRLHQRLQSGLMSMPPVEWGHLSAPPRIPRQVAMGYLLWLMDLSPADLDGIASRLHFPASLRDSVQAAARLLPEVSRLVEANPGTVYDRLEEMPPWAVYGVYLVDEKSRSLLQQYMLHWRKIAPKTTGKDLMKRGVPPGPVYKTILRRLRQAWLDGEVTTSQQEQALLEKLVGK